MIAEEENKSKGKPDVNKSDHSSDWSDIDDSELSEKIGVINSFPVEEEKKDLGDISRNDTNMLP